MPHRQLKGAQATPGPSGSKMTRNRRTKVRRIYYGFNPTSIQRRHLRKQNKDTPSRRGVKDQQRHQPIPKSPPSNRQTKKRTASRAALTKSANAQQVRPGLRKGEQEEPRAPRRQPTEELATPGPSGTERGDEEERRGARTCAGQIKEAPPVPVSNNTSSKNKQRKPSAKRQTKRKPDVHKKWRSNRSTPATTEYLINQPPRSRGSRQSNAEEGWKNDTAPS